MNPSGTSPASGRAAASPTFAPTAAATAVSERGDEATAVVQPTSAAADTIGESVRDAGEASAAAATPALSPRSAAAAAALTDRMEELFHESHLCFDDYFLVLVRATRQGWVSVQDVAAKLHVPVPVLQTVAPLCNHVVMNEERTAVRKKEPLRKISQTVARAHAIAIDCLPDDADVHAISTALAHAAGGVAPAWVRIVDNRSGVLETPSTTAFATAVRQHNTHPRWAIAWFDDPVYAANVASSEHATVKLGDVDCPLSHKPRPDTSSRRNSDASADGRARAHSGASDHDALELSGSLSERRPRRGSGAGMEAQPSAGSSGGIGFERFRRRGGTGGHASAYSDSSDDDVKWESIRRGRAGSDSPPHDAADAPANSVPQRTPPLHRTGSRSGGTLLHASGSSSARRDRAGSDGLFGPSAAPGTGGSSAPHERAFPPPSAPTTEAAQSKSPWLLRAATRRNSLDAANAAASSAAAAPSGEQVGGGDNSSGSGGGSVSGAAEGGAPPRDDSSAGAPSTTVSTDGSSVASGESRNVRVAKGPALGVPGFLAARGVHSLSSGASAQPLPLPGGASTTTTRSSSSPVA